MGWGHIERISWENGHVEQDTRLSETWKRLFYDNRMLRPSCYCCPYTVAVGRPGDLTIADFWGVERTSHARSDDQTLGVSLVIANCMMGLQLLSEVGVDLEVAELAEALPRNPMLQHPSVCEGDHDTPWHGLYADGMRAMLKRQRYLTPRARHVASHLKRALKRVIWR